MKVILVKRILERCSFFTLPHIVFLPPFIVLYSFSILDMKQEVHCIVKPYKEAEKNINEERDKKN